MLWFRVARYAEKQGWVKDEQTDTSIYLIEKVFDDLVDPNVLIAVALSLVPEGVGFKLSGPYAEYQYYCKMFAATSKAQATYEPELLDTSSFAGTPALALCIAALKAQRSK